LEGIGAKSEEKLAKHGITTIKAICDLTPEKIKEISDAAREVRISDSQLNKFKSLAENAKPGDPPEKSDYRKFDNPYKERYGDQWQERIRATSQMSPSVCVAKMIKHIVAESALIFRGTKYEDSWFFNHDALSLMTAKETVEWMKEKGYYERWLLPVMGLHSDDPDLKAYLGTIPGSGPENMLWDLSLNKDAHEDTNRHVVLTHELAEDDLRKFDLSTPKRGSWAYH
jgi:transposase-like protein